MKGSFKFITVSLALALTISSLSGCGKSENKTGDSNVKVTTEADAKPGSQALPIVTTPTTFKFWHATTADITKATKTLNDSEYYKELEKRTGVHFEFIHPTLNQEKASLNLLLASGDLPDIVLTYAGLYEFPGGFDKAIDDGTIIKLNELIKKYAPNYTELINKDPDVKKATMTDTNNIAAYYSIMNEAQTSYMGMTVRKDWLDELGLKIPVTYDDWEAMLKEFKDKKGAEAPMMLNYTGFSGFNTFNAGYGVGSSFYKVDGKVKYGPLEAGYKEYVTMMNKWYKAGLIDKDFATKKDRTPSTNFISTGKAGAWEDLWSRLSSDKQQSKDPKYNIVGVQAPVKKAGDKLHIGQYNAKVGQASWSISKNCKNPEVIAKLVNYIFSPEGVILSNYGVEGKTFTKGTDGKPQYTELIAKNPDGLNFAQALAKYVQTSGAQQYQWQRQKQVLQPEEIKASETWNQNNDFSYNMPATTLTVDEGNEYAQVMGDISTYVDEMSLKFILGNEPLSKYDEFVNRIKSMKIDRAIQLQQAALDRYNTRK